jgi:hypothetical protein
VGAISRLDASRRHLMPINSAPLTKRKAQFRGTLPIA